MSRNWAIAIGINDYNPNNFHPLRYAKRDAEAIQAFFQNEADFDEVYFFADDSPKITLPNGSAIPTYPSCGNLLSFLQDRFEKPFLSKGDNCWFFFAGHGLQYQNRDYLMPIDAPNPRSKEPTYAISVSYIRERLSRSGADNVILLLDACRDEGGRSSTRPEWEPQQGIITISACSPLQKSWEVDELQHGVFTFALLEALRSKHYNCATVERFDQYLRARVPQLCRHFGKQPEQIPRVSVDPVYKAHFVLSPKQATPDDITRLKQEAYRIWQLEGNLELSEQIWERVLSLQSGADKEAILALQKIAQQRLNHNKDKFPENYDNFSATRSISNLLPISNSTQTPTSLIANSPQSDAFRSSTQHTILNESISSSQTQQVQHDSLKSLYQKNLEHYKQQFLLTIKGKTFVSRSERKHLEDLRQVLNIMPEDASAIEQKLIPGRSVSNRQNFSTPSESNSSSAKKFHYSKLCSLLNDQKWREADQETLNILLKLAERERERQLRSGDISNLSCADLRAINQIWNRCSDGKFGFGIQRQIWQECGSPAVNTTGWETFGDRVGWRKRRLYPIRSADWISYPETRFELSAPSGHLPRGYVALFANGMTGIQVFLARVKACGL